MSGDQKGFADQLAIIAGAGLGRSYALDLAARGVRIVVNDVGHLPGGVSTAEDAVVEIRAAGSEAIASRRRWTPGAASTSSSTTPAFLRNGYCEDLTDDEIASVLDVHLAAAFHVTRPAWRVMKERGYGRVVLTSSASGAFGLVGQANYGAAKAGVLGLGRVLALEGYERGIKVNCLLPMATTTMADAHPIPDFRRHSERWLPDGPVTGLAARRDRSPVMVTYLVSPECEPTGEAFSVTGGRYGRVFTGVADGWLAPDGPVTTKDVVEHLDQIRDLSVVTVPESLHAEIADFARKAAQTA